MYQSHESSISTEDGDQSLDSIAAVDLKEPEMMADVPRYPPTEGANPKGKALILFVSKCRSCHLKGIFGAAVRKLKNIPPCVWVVNLHSEEITVVVSKYKPNRLLTGMGLSASPNGVGISFETTTFVGPASRKTLAAQDQGRDNSTAVFPLWTRTEGFGVISVFKGPEKILFIENDRVPLGATVYFANKPDLRIVKYQPASETSAN
ncbi:uncharacterized protein N7500_009434 [Penicillium coprophilum]|uniref:uncharacterized protein n=1 Tax=Penicillium coprophilum TaxID=36646 RepID=UPI0023A502C2|nr:uncharacterized protein N7500_009434 [Penicillium coprophilum]KAJ5153995.1 hypothetical protein N7500_009434 [Penicillium coprophilum]